MATTAADYQWIEDYSDLAEAYCVTLVRGVTVQEFLTAMKAEPEGDLTGYAALDRRAGEVYDEHSGDKYLIGATTIPGDHGEWVLGLEANGFLGTLPHLLEPLSSGTRLVSHFCNVNAVDRFQWYEDGTLCTYFEPLFPTQRDGSTPDELLEAMAEVGFDLEEDDEEFIDSPTTEAAFALADRLTGVHLTPEVLDNATFATGLTPRTTTRTS